LITPFSAFECTPPQESLPSSSLVEQMMLYGSYPEVINHPTHAVSFLKKLASDYLYKDILALESIKKPEQLLHLLQLLARQIGNEVSYTEI
jgi:uncharacterized protein